MSVIDIVVLAIVIVSFVLALRKIIKDKRNGKYCSGCGGDCSSCHRK